MFTTMTRLYVIGGKSRTGKSKISRKVRISHGPLEVLNTDSFRLDGNDDQAWVRLTNHLTRTIFSSDVLIEGVAITPQRIHGLDIPALTLQKAVFLGYSRESHAHSILNHARQTGESDWVYRQLQKNPSYKNDVWSWMKPGIAESAQLKIDAEGFGYGYFDVTDYADFEKYVTEVIEYLLISEK
jgi:hypothetical protein